MKRSEAAAAAVMVAAVVVWIIIVAGVLRPWKRGAGASTAGGTKKTWVLHDKTSQLQNSSWTNADGAEEKVGQFSGSIEDARRACEANPHCGALVYLPDQRFARFFTATSPDVRAFDGGAEVHEMVTTELRAPPAGVAPLPFCVASTSRVLGDPFYVATPQDCLAICAADPACRRASLAREVGGACRCAVGDATTATRFPGRYDTGVLTVAMKSAGRASGCCPALPVEVAALPFEIGGDAGDARLCVATAPGPGGWGDYVFAAGSAADPAAFGSRLAAARFSVVDREWGLLPPLAASPGFEPRSCAVVGGALAVTGLAGGAPALALFDLASGEWRAGPAPPAEIALNAVASAGGLLFAVGSRDGNATTVPAAYVLSRGAWVRSPIQLGDALTPVGGVASLAVALAGDGSPIWFFWAKDVGFAVPEADPAARRAFADPGRQVAAVPGGFVSLSGLAGAVYFHPVEGGVVRKEIPADTADVQGVYRAAAALASGGLAAVAGRSLFVINPC